MSTLRKVLYYGKFSPAGSLNVIVPCTRASYLPVIKALLYKVFFFSMWYLLVKNNGDNYDNDDNDDDDDDEDDNDAPEKIIISINQSARRGWLL